VSRYQLVDGPEGYQIAVLTLAWPPWWCLSSITRKCWPNAAVASKMFRLKHDTLCDNTVAGRGQRAAAGVGL